MNKVLMMAFALVLSAIVLASGQSANAAAATASVATAQTETVDGAVTKVWYRRYGYGPGWGYRRHWGWGGPFYYGGFYGPACHWRCGPYRCWRVCW